MVNKDEYIKFHGSCEKSCVGATGRKLGTRLKEHIREVEAITRKPFTKPTHIRLIIYEQNKSCSSRQPTGQHLPSAFRKLQCTGYSILALFV